MISVIFDMDGTLLDTQSICVPAWEWAGNNQGIPGMGAHIQMVCGMNEAGWSGYLEENFPCLDIELFKKEMREYIIDNLKVRFMPGAEELLEFLDENNIKYAIASGSSVASIRHHLGELGVLDKFEVMVGGRDVKNGKPAPDIFLLTAEKLGVAPCDCFVFEDSANGVRAGYAAGMKVFGIADVAAFGDDIKKLMFKELNSLNEAINILKEFI